MLKKLVDIRRFIALALGGILLILWALYLIFGSGEDKIVLLVLTPILPVVIFCFVRLIFKLIRINATVKSLNIFICFFLIAGVLGSLVDLIGFINGYPNGLSPTLGACMGLIVAVLEEANKNI